MKPHTTITWAGFVITAALATAAPLPVQAEIEPIVPPGAKLLTPFSAPKLPRIPGWETSLKASINRQARLLFPEGAPPERPGAMILALAVRKTSVEGVRTLDELIDGENVDARSRDVGVEITEIPVVTDKAGRRIRVFAQRGSTRLSYQVSAYGEETDKAGVVWWTVFTLTADSQASLATAVGPFQDMLRNYR